jgi:hypothetical protein
MTLKCAWCPDFDPKAPENKQVSHGICKSCQARLLAEERS